MTSNDNNNINQPSSMFSEIMKQQATKQVKDSDTQFEESMNRGDGIFKQTTHISEIKDENQNMELNNKQNERQRTIENRRRLKHNIKVEFGKSVKDSLTIDAKAYETAQNLEVNPNDLDNYIKTLYSDNQLEQYYGLVAIRKLLTLPQDPLIGEIIDKSVVFALVNTLDHKLPEFVYEAVVCICSITSGNSDQIKSITSKGAQKKLTILCDSQFIEIQEQAIWGVGNLSSENSQLRDQLIKEGALNKILFYLKNAERKTLVKNCIWSYSNFCKGKDPDYNVLSPVSYYILIF
jgi:importin subunit alpha-1